MNKTIMNYFGLLILATLLSACGRPSKKASSQEETAERQASFETPGQVRVLTDSTSWATDPYLSEDNEGNLVLCWTERPGEDAQYLLKYAVFDAASATFRPPVTVSSSVGTVTSAESANRVAFKADGTVLALFGKHFDDPANRFAGAIQYSLSTDKGASWTRPAYLHSDTLHQHGRGFFDIAALANGELGAVWLDGRYGEADTGSALFFASTIPGGGFGPDKMIGSSTCECCRTDLLVDSAGTLHVAYRDILFPPDRMGRQVRDMVYTRSDDNGLSFDPLVRISADNWEVAGCPHAGPSLAAEAGGVRAVWFTAGAGPEKDIAGGQTGGGAGGPGVYLASLGNQRHEFGSRELLSASGRHPQLVALGGERFAIAWDEAAAQQETGQGHDHGAGAHREATVQQGQASGPDAHADSQHEHANGRHGQRSGGGPAIVLRLSGPGGETNAVRLTDGSYPAHHPVLASPASGKLLLAWVAETGGTSAIAYSLVELPQN